MSKVFEALQRGRQNRKENSEGRDPLAAEAGTPETAAGDNDDDSAEIFDLPALIGAPVGRRSNDGAVFPFAGPSSGPSAGPSAGALPGATAGNGGNRAGLSNSPDHSDYGSPAPSTLGSGGKGKRKSRRITEDLLASSPEDRRLTFEPSPGESDKPVSDAPLKVANIETLNLDSVHPRLIMLTDPESSECEQYRTLRTQIFHASEKRLTQTIVVTSALAGEGKTSTVLNLAFAIAQSKEKRVLVIDGDLRRPNVAAFLGLRPKTGLGETLSGEVDPISSIICIEGHELYVLPVSNDSKNSTELLSSERMIETISLLRGYFDYILIDSPPVMPFSDSRLLANISDAVILVVRAGLASYDTIEKAIESLPHKSILGVVLNGAEHFKDSSYYNYYYNYSKREQEERSIRGRLKAWIRESPVGRKLRL